MNTKKLLWIAVLVVLLNLALAAAAGAGPGAANPNCTNLPQAGKIAVPAGESAAWSVIQFAVPFCELPVVVVSPGENTGLIQIGVVTPSIAWVLAARDRGNEAVVFWQAIPATQ